MGVWLAGIIIKHEQDVLKLIGTVVFELADIAGDCQRPLIQVPLDESQNSLFLWCRFQLIAGYFVLVVLQELTVFYRCSFSGGWVTAVVFRRKLDPLFLVDHVVVSVLHQGLEYFLEGQQVQQQ